MRFWALSSARLERRSYMASRRIRRDLTWKPRLTGGRRFKSARAHFYLSLFFTISVFLFILLLPYMLLTSFNFSQSIVISIQKQIEINNKEATKFVINCINSFCNINSGSSNGFKKEELIHLVDVKNLLSILKIIFSFSLFFSLLLFPYIKLHKKVFLFLILIFILFLLISLISFNSSFEIFHKILFKKNYEFPENYLLVKIFPSRFFIFCFIFSSLVSLLLFFLLFFLEFLKFKRLR